MSAFPDDLTLIARGKYSTLSKERRQQIERCGKITDTIRLHLMKAFLDVQKRPPVDQHSLDSMRACLGNYENSWNRIEELCAEMDELKPLAWDNADE